MKSRVLKIKTSGAWEFVEVDGTKKDPIPLETLQKAVGGYVQSYNLREIGLPGVDLWLNEEGKIYGLKVNAIATLLSLIYRHHDLVVGDVLLCGITDSGKSVGLNKAQETRLHDMLQKIMAAIAK